MLLIIAINRKLTRATSLKKIYILLYYYRSLYQEPINEPPTSRRSDNRLPSK